MFLKIKSVITNTDVNYIGRVAGFALVIIALIGLVGDICYHVVADNTSDIETVSLKSGTISRTVNTTAVLIRSESLIESDIVGFRVYSVNDGERIAAGTEIASVYSDTVENRRVAEEIADIDRRLYILESAQNLESAYTISSSEKRIQSLQKEISEASAAGDVAAAGALTTELNIMLNVKMLRNGRKSDFKVEIASLRSEKQKLLDSLGGTEGVIKASASGFLYSSCDGYERVFGDASVIDLGYDELSESLNADPDGSLVGQAKMVTDYRWYLAAPIPTDELEHFASGNKYAVDVGGISLDMTLYRTVSARGQASAYLIFSYDRIPTGMSISRKTDIDITYGESSGFMVPIKALRQVDGYNGVYALHGSVIKFRRVKVLDINATYAVCDEDYSVSGTYQSLKFYDRIVIKGEDLHDGKIVD